MLASRLKLRNGLRPAGVALVSALMIVTSYAHVTVQPKQSAGGADEKYTMRVPTEKPIPTIRIEVEFPMALQVSSFEPKPGWKIEQKKDAGRKLIGVVLIGSIPPKEFALFNFSAKNPAQSGKLSFHVVQIYQDGSKAEWTGPEGSRTPAPIVEIK